MAGHTDNSLVIDAPLEVAWRVANDVGRWPEVFVGEYSAAEVIEEQDDRILFRLTTVPQENGVSYSWVSERVLDHRRHLVNARRIDTGPFRYMHIFQSFESVPEGVRLRWVQDFEMQPGAPFDDAQMTERINRNSRQQLLNHKEFIERNRLGRAPDAHHVEERGTHER